MNKKLWTVVARYCSGNAWLVPRKVNALTRDDAKEKAKKRFPTIWCGYKLAEIIIVPFSDIYKGIKVDKLLEDPMPVFRRPRISVELSPNHVSIGHRVKRITGRFDS